MLNDATLNIKMPKELYDRLKSEAAKKNIPLSSLIRLICSEYLDNK